MAKNILCTFATSELVGSSRGVTKLMGVDRRNIRKAIDRRLASDTLGNVFWIDYRRATPANVLFKHFIEHVIEWWTTQIIISPNQKDVITLRISCN